MTHLPDNSAYYDPDRAFAEDVQWLLDGHYKQHAKVVMQVLTEPHINTVVEIGCGSGLLASLLPTDIKYLGIDSNPWFLAKAKERNPTRQFWLGDLRAHGMVIAAPDLVLAFNVLKHFGLHEWGAIVRNLFSTSRHGLFNVQMMDEDRDDGKEFHHVFVTEGRLRRALATARQRERWRETSRVWTHKSGETARDVIVHTSTVTLEEHEEDMRYLPEPSSMIPYARRPLCVAGVEKDDLHNYSLRWVAEGSHSIPVLYFKGRRVTQPWELHLVASDPGDRHGGNANTA